MAKRTNTKSALFFSIVSLFLCFAMLLGTTLAWFTDSVTSTGNKIQAGTLKVDLQLLDKNGGWNSIKAEKAPIWDSEANKLWEPGYTDVKIFKIVNDGSLALKWKAAFTAEEELSILANVIDVYVKPWGVLTEAEAQQSVAYPADRSLTGYTKVGTLAEFVETIEATTYGVLNANESAYLGIALHMQESADNIYQELTIGAFDITIIATQKAEENDSFDNTYDENAAWPAIPGHISYQSPDVTLALNEDGVTTEDTVVGEGLYTAIIPSGTKFAEGVEKTSLSVQSMYTSNANIEIQNGEEARSYDVHIGGLAEDNTVPVPVELEGFFRTGLNSTSVSMKHVENGITNAVTLVDNPVNHNEFSYDPATGDVVLSITGCSEIVAVTDNKNLWKGTFDYTWYDANKSELEIASAEQLAGFGRIVDGTAEGIEADTFKDKTIKITRDINLAGGYSLNPIGCGYADTSINSNGVDGRVFSGTFDGQGHTISGLYQNGWELRLSYCNLGGGLFASVKDAYIKNLTISGAEIVMECVEQGIVAGLVQGDSTFENINIQNSSVANYQKATGGLIGEVSGSGTTRIENVTIDSTVVVGSLWGDFDAPVGGVIGARWDNENADPQIVMKNVDVAARLDVYNDVTSSYQWYAYRRAGMLIGNTEQVAKDGRTAAADFLTCEDVKVSYGDWVNYHYCEFNNHESRWPWVRVEAGENCSAFSNPRYGVPNDIYGNRVVDMNHVHQDGDECYVELTFNQLYGGGQGVYGQPEHDGVDEYVYSITYINDNKILAKTYVTSNDSAFDLSTDKNAAAAETAAKQWVTAQGYTVEFGGWANAGSTKVTSIDAGNTENIKLYPSFRTPYTARFVDQQGNVLAWCLFHSEKTGDLEKTKEIAESKLTLEEDFVLEKWVVAKRTTDNTGATNTTYEDYNLDNFTKYETDVTIYPVYKFSGDVSLIPVDSDNNGEVNHYEVTGYGAGTDRQELVEIPAYVNGAPVTIIRTDAFSSYDDLHSVRIPGTITAINSQSFTADNPNRPGEQRDTVTLYYEGDPAVWNEAMKKYNEKDYSGILKQNWDNMMGESSCVFFLDENGKVDLSKGYWELAKTGGFIGIGSKFVWQYHNHTYGSNSGCGNEHNNKTNYSGTCDCSSCDGAIRPDAEYWTATTN